jgi:tRNA pseudouridine32 synthase/23S rRNA pseudouridine746 synthase
VIEPGGGLTQAEIDFVRSLVIYEDAEVIALAKPPGLSSQGGRITARTLDDFLGAFAKKSGVRPRLVHRLDRDTSGVILTARSQPAAAFLGRALMARRMKKTYLAVVAPGAPEPASGVIDSPLQRHSIGREVYVRTAAADAPGAQVALTRYRTLQADEVAAVVELNPRTGRMHQLRAHMASIGRPIVGDARYGGVLTLYGRPAPRLLLHALALSFPHPAGGERRVEAAPPADMAAFMAAVG